MVGVLLQHGEQVQESLDRVPRGAEVGVSDAFERSGACTAAMPSSRMQVGGFVAGMPGRAASLVSRTIEVFRRQAGQAQHRSGVVHESVDGEAVLGQARLQGSV